MAEYIERERLRESLKSHYHPTDKEYESDRQWAVGYNAGLDRALHSLHYAPAEEVAPVVHGRWMIAVCKRRRVAPVADDMICSACKQATERLDGISFLYCPNCGARMDGGL